jgi:hypothetical protein
VRGSMTDQVQLVNGVEPSYQCAPPGETGPSYRSESAPSSQEQEQDEIVLEARTLFAWTGFIGGGQLSRGVLWCFSVSLNLHVHVSFCGPSQDDGSDFTSNPPSRVWPTAQKRRTGAAGEI